MDISIHAPLTGCDYVDSQKWGGYTRISIHAPLTGCDTRKVARAAVHRKFQSTHPSRGATMAPCTAFTISAFQSTHPSRGATVQRLHGNPKNTYFNPRTPHGVRLRTGPRPPERSGFQSTHPSRGATNLLSPMLPSFRFQSTHPSRGATRLSSPHQRPLLFQSTHPSRGATTAIRASVSLSCYFNPRTPHGVRRQKLPL